MYNKKIKTILKSLPDCFGEAKYFDFYECKFKNKCGHRGSCVGEIERRQNLKEAKK